jgi:hypothetical protein
VEEKRVEADEAHGGILLWRQKECWKKWMKKWKNTSTIIILKKLYNILFLFIFPFPP